jgi:plastocyanin
VIHSGSRPVSVGMKTIALLLTVFALFLVGCGGSSDSSSGSASTAAGASGAKAVTIRDYTYKPAAITVPVGTTVRFTNQDSTPHTATSKESGVFESGPIDPGKTGTIKLETAGTFTYYCVFHPFMKGTITVTSAG